jgi:hypothetical protein
VSEGDTHLSQMGHSRLVELRLKNDFGTRVSTHVRPDVRSGSILLKKSATGSERATIESEWTAS